MVDTDAETPARHDDEFPAKAGTPQPPAQPEAVPSDDASGAEPDASGAEADASGAEPDASGRKNLTGPAGTATEPAEAATEPADTATGLLEVVTGPPVPEPVYAATPNPLAGTATTASSTTTTTPVTSIWDEQTASGFRQRWRDVQVRFVDDPRGSVGEAGALLDEVTGALAKLLAERRQELDSCASVEESDTEELRTVLRRYRDFVHHLLDL